MNAKSINALRVGVAALGLGHLLTGGTAIVAGLFMVLLAAPATQTARGQNEFGAAILFEALGAGVVFLGIVAGLMAIGCLLLFRKVGRTSRVGIGGIVFLIGAIFAGLVWFIVFWRIYF